MESSPFVTRRQQLLASLPDESIAVIFSGTAPLKSRDVTYAFSPNRNFFYLTGLDRPLMILTLAKSGSQVLEKLFIEKADPSEEKWTGYRVKSDEAREISGVKDVGFTEDFYAYFARIVGRVSYSHVYLDVDRLDWNASATSGQHFAKEIQEKYPSLVIRNIGPAIARLRVVKDETEIANLRKAIDVTNQAILNMYAHAEAGMMEYELEAYFDFSLRKNGVKEPGYASIIAGGRNAVVLHYDSNDRRVDDGDVVLLDLGAQWNYYSADISRSFPINGKFTERQKQFYELVLKAELAAIEAVKPGVTWAELNALTKRILADGLKDLRLIEHDEELAKYYYHSVGHFLGLNVHDVGVSDIPFEPGMVVTIEPGLYIEEESLGIRIEDDILVTETGHENLSKHLIKTVEDIETFMASGKREK